MAPTKLAAIVRQSFVSCWSTSTCNFIQELCLKLSVISFKIFVERDVLFVVNVAGFSNSFIIKMVIKLKMAAIVAQFSIILCMYLIHCNVYDHIDISALTILVSIGRVSLARENEAGGSWGQEVHILHVNV